MKKLYENIEDINIKGGVSQLSEVIRAMDISLQNIADNSDQLTTYLVRYSAANKGSQFEKVVKVSSALRDKLYQASLELNDMQNQIVVYQNKIYRYEDLPENAPAPNRYMVSRRTVTVSTSEVKFTRTDMMNIVAALRNYSERVYHHIKTINEKKNSIAAVWNDSQYDSFAEFIDSITSNIVEGIKVYEEYVIYIEEKIKELN